VTIRTFEKLLDQGKSVSVCAHLPCLDPVYLDAFYDAIKAEISSIIVLLSNDSAGIRSMATKWLGKLIEQCEFVCLSPILCSDGGM